jgi:Bacterial Ig domain/Protein of unknown function (DUF642)
VAPAITLAGPTNGAVITLPATISLAASVVTNGNTVSGVQFYYNSTNLIGQSTSPPYILNWSNPNSGNYNVFARVAYNGGSILDSSAVGITVVNSSLNFSFESPAIGSGNYQYDPSGAAWTFNGASGNGSGIVANGSGFSNPNAPLGSQAAFVQGYGGISQTLAGFSPGITYTITFAAAQRSGVSQHGGESWNVMIDNTVITNYSPGSTSYVNYAASFTATAAIHTLSFIGTDLAGGDNTVFIDNVKITPPIPPVAPLIALTSPVNNAAFATPGVISIAASVTSNANVINGVNFYYNGTNLIGQVASAPYSYVWTNPAAASYSVLARVVYNNSSLASSAAANITVTNLPAPVLKAMLQGNQVFTLQFQGVKNVNYVVETSTNLINWTLVYTNSVTDAGADLFIYTNAAAQDAVRFYRIIQ